MSPVAPGQERGFRVEHRLGERSSEQNSGIGTIRYSKGINWKVTYLEVKTCLEDVPLERHKMFYSSIVIESICSFPHCSGPLVQVSGYATDYILCS